MGQNKAVSHHYISYYRNRMILSLLVLIPVLVVSIVNFFVLYNNNVKTIRNNLRVESERTLELLNNNLSAIPKIVSTKRLERIFSTAAQSKVGTVYYPIIQELRKDAMWTTFFSSISYYNVESGLVYKMNSAQIDDEYFGTETDEHAYYPSDSWEMQPWDRKTLEEMGNHIRVMRICNAKGNDSGVLFAVPLEIQSDRPPLSYMLFTIADSDLYNIINANEGVTCVLEYNEIPIYSTSAEIRKQIYEEKQVPDSFYVSDILSFESQGMKVNWNISHGLLMQRLFPTIILEGAVTFIVMVLGLMLMLYISRKSYEPIQGLLNRLPTRCNTDPVDEFQYINFILDDFTYSKHFFEESVQELRREKYLFYILDNQVEPGGALYNQCLHEGIRVDRKYFACILIEDSEANYQLFEKLSSPDSLQKGIDVYSLYIMGNKYLFLLTSDMNYQDFQSFLSGLSTQKSQLARISEVIEGVQNVRKAYTSVCWPEEKQKSEETSFL